MPLYRKKVNKFTESLCTIFVTLRNGISFLYIQTRQIKTIIILYLDTIFFSHKTETDKREVQKYVSSYMMNLH